MFLTRIRFNHNKEISFALTRRKCGVENLEHRLRTIRLRWFGHGKHRDKNSLLRRVMELEVEGQ